VGIFYPFFALGLGLYFVCQAFNTLLWPVLGTFLRLIIIIILFLFLKYYDALNYQNILIVFAFSIVVYGLFIAISLYYGPWRKISQN
jgi:Na+-driven multidrug efflux pump